MSSSDDDDVGSRRQSSVVRIANSIRASAASAVSAVEERIEVGTIGGTVLNTTCNVIGAGVLSLPYAAYHGGLGWSVMLTVMVACIGAFSAYVIFIGCDRTGAYFINEVFANALIGKPKALIAEEESTRRRPPISHSQADLSSNSMSPAHDGDEMVRAPKERDPYEWDEVEEAKKNRMRMFLSMIIDALIFLNNFIMLAVYSRIIIDSIPPVLIGFLHADGIWTSNVTWCVGPAIIFFGLTSVRNMAELKWSSILGIVTILYAVLAIVIEFCRLGYQGHAPDGQKDTREVDYFTIKPTFPGAIAVLSVAYGYHFNAPIFYHELHDKSPKRMMKTVAISFPIISVAYLLTIIFGYLSFGHHVADEDAGGDIVNNYSKHNAFLNTVRLGLFFHFACVYPVMSVCVRHSFHRFILTAMGRREDAVHPDMPARVPRWAIVGEAFILVSTSSALAYSYGNVGQLMTYVGAISGASVMLTVPGIIGVCVWSTDYSQESLPLIQGRRRREPPPHSDRRKLMLGLSIGLIVVGVTATLTNFIPS